MRIKNYFKPSHNPYNFVKQGMSLRPWMEQHETWKDYKTYAQLLWAAVPALVNSKLIIPVVGGFCHSRVTQFLKNIPQASAFLPKIRFIPHDTSLPGAKFVNTLYIRAISYTVCAFQHAVLYFKLWEILVKMNKHQNFPWYTILLILNGN